MAKLNVMEAREMVQALGEKYFKEANIIDSLDGTFVIEEDGNYFTVEIHAHVNRGELSPQVLDRFKAVREKREEKMKKLNKSFT